MTLEETINYYSDLALNYKEFSEYHKNSTDKKSYEFFTRNAEHYKNLATWLNELNKQTEQTSEWDYSQENHNIAICKHCGYEYYLGTYGDAEKQYCPKCGKKMINYKYNIPAYYDRGLVYL